MFGISYKLKLLEPVLANHLAGDSNSARSFKFVPGAVMRGAVIRAYQQRHDQSLLDADDPKIRRLFFDGTTRFLHAYLFADRYESRALPVPLSWRKLKDEEVTKELAITIYDLSQAFDKNGEQAVGKDKFCVSPGYVYEVDPQHRLSVHTQRDALRGRSTETYGAVYRYEALPKNIVLKGIVLTETKIDADEIQTLMNGLTVYLGKARTAGYGQAKVEGVELLEENWREVGGGLNISAIFVSDEGDSSEWNGEYDTGSTEEAVEIETESSRSATSKFTLTCLSETIVRDGNGQYTLDPLPALQKRLGNDKNLKLSTLEENRDLIFRQAKIIGGFNRKWNLPLPQVAAIEAGSVFVINSDRPIPLIALQQLEETSIGERRAEGYGRVAVNWHTATTLDYLKSEDELNSSAEPDEPDASALSADEKHFAMQFLARLLRSDLESKLLKRVNEIKIKGKVENSQLSRWRSVIRSAFAAETKAEGIKRLNQFRTKEETKASAAWEKMRRARVDKGGGQDSPRLTDWIAEVLGENRKAVLQDWLYVNEQTERDLGGAIKATVTNELADEFRLRLLDAVLKRKAKEQAAQSKKQGGSHVGN